MAENKPELQRGLEARHIELIALGGTIGVGLFMGAASTLKWAGPINSPTPIWPLYTFDAAHH
ncbi:hypothetical protein C5939_01890 [Cronobacter sakazakii]|nr:hypothetical protein C5939_01890 [Cronobacter sakazakii]